MKELLTVLNSDRPCLTGIRMTLGALVDGLERAWDSGRPFFVSHDQHRLLGWGRPLGIHLEPGLARLTGISGLIENDAEGQQVKQALAHFRAQQVQKNVAPHEFELKDRLTGHLKGGHELMDLNCAALHETGVAERAFKGLFAQRDKDQLVPMAALNPIAPGVYERDGLLLFASDYLRRSLSRHNTLNDALLIRLQELASYPDLSVKVRLDPDIVGLAHTYVPRIELAYWWGPRFDEDLTSITPGICRHEADERTQLFSGISCTDFWWHDQSNLRTLECEEVLDRPSLGIDSDTYGCRYVHSIIDSNSAEPAHIDGAVRLYDTAMMLNRQGQNMYQAGRQTRYVKLWRIDGPLPVPKWKEVITHHFRDNELVGEYLGGNDTVDIALPLLLDSDGDLLQRFIPNRMVAGQGIRTSISFHPKVDPDQPEIQLVSLDTFGTSQERIHYIEDESFEIVKWLRRQGIHVAVPPDLARLTFKDGSTNLATFLHCGDGAVEAAEQTMRAIATFCNAWTKRDDNRTVAFNVGVAYDDRTVFYSFAGNVTDLALALQDDGVRLPANAGASAEWIESLYEKLTALFPASNDRPSLDGMLQITGLLRIDRRFIDRSICTAFKDENTGSLMVRFELSKDDADLRAMLESGRLSWAEVWRIEQSKCSRCQTDYLVCDCSKYLDEAVTQVIERADLVDLFWTTDPAVAKSLC